METVTTGLVGTTLGTSLFLRRHGPAAVVAFTVASMLPDADSLFVAKDTFVWLKVHRSYSHSFVGAVGEALLIAGALKLFRARASFLALAAVAYAGVLFHMTTDCATWWGTQIFWPFSDHRVRYGLVFILDPWFVLIGVAPLVAWAVAARRSRPFPLRAFHAAAGAVAAYALLLLAMRAVAFSGLRERCGAEPACRPIDVLPQPFSPFRWMQVADLGDRYRLDFVDLLRGRGPIETRVFEKREGGPAAVTDATPEGRTLLWFHHLPVREVERREGRTTIVYRDVAYERGPTPLFDSLWGPGYRVAPYRYRFVLEAGEIVERGWLER